MHFDHLSLPQAVQSQINDATLLELSCALLIPLIAIFLKLQIKRYVFAHTQRHFSLLDYLFPLLSPLLALVFSLIAISAFRILTLDDEVLLFTLKMVGAWLAFSLIVQLSSRRTAGWFVALAVVPITLLHIFGLWEETIAALSSIKFSIGTLQLNAYIIIKGVLALFVLYWLARSSTRVIEQRLGHITNLRASNRALILKLYQIALYCIIFLFCVQMLGISLTALGVFGGALGVGLGFGLQKIASNFVSGIILLFEKSIEIDDLIELSDGTTGFVRQTHARYTRVELLNGREMFIPNEDFISQRVISWTHTNRKAQIEIVVGVGYECDIQKARQLMVDAATSHKARLAGSDPTCYMTAFGDSAIQLTLKFWITDITANGRQEPRSDVMIAIWQSFKENNITVPFPQQEVRVIGLPKETI